MKMPYCVTRIGVITGLLVSALTIHAQTDGVSEHIVFGANIDDRRTMAVYEMRPDGQGLKRLIAPTVQGRGEYHPHVSPNGKQIAFTTYRYGGWKIAISDIDGSHVRRLTAKPHYVYDASWSPDGQTLVFHKVTTPRAPYFDGDMDIYTINVDGSGEKNLTPSADGDRTPSFSPDGRKIVFASRRDENYEIYVMNRDGSSPTNLTGHKSSDFAGSFSPDGGRIAFLSDREGVLNLYAMNADGSNLNCLTQGMAVSRSAFKFDYSINWHFTTDWSRDGARIVFAGPGMDDKNDIYVFDRGKKTLTNLTNSPADDKHPEWAYYW